MKKLNKPSLLIIYTGGTFGMELNPKKTSTYQVPDLNKSDLKSRLLRSIPEIKSLANCDVEILCNQDSCDLGSSHWIEMAQFIKSHKKKYSGVIILHGTDTLAYTANALSYLLASYSKPILITGAQRPLSALRSDARSNLISSVELLSRRPKLKNHVYVFFNHQLFLGSKTRKKSPTEFDAFESPRFPVLAKVGSTIHYSDILKNLKKSKNNQKLKARFSDKVLHLQITPNFPFKQLDQHVTQQFDGFVLTVFPSGTAPTKDPNLTKFLTLTKKHKKPVVLVTERTGWRSDPKTYSSGKKLMELGCIWADDLTPEHAFIKTSLILGQESPYGKFKSLWKKLKLEV